MSHNDLGYVGRDLKMLKRFAKAAGLDLDNLSPRDEELLSRLVMLSLPFGFEVQMKPGYICEKLTQAREAGKRVRIVPDRKFWKNGPNRYQLDGWSYHLELYTPRFRKDVTFGRRKPGQKIYWVEYPKKIGVHEFSFDREKIYNLFADYPHNLTPEEKVIFDSENPYWVEFFKDR